MYGLSCLIEKEDDLFMRCPVCEDSKMREVDRDGILIDICPSCKGVWLDRGELDKLVSGVREAHDEISQFYGERNRSGNTGYYEGHYGGQQKSHYPKKRKKKNILETFGDLF
jgi:Zn-finger nucleic acid-binding protein